MSESPQVSPAVHFVLGPFESNSTFALPIESATTVSCPSVLLVGRHGSLGKSILRSLNKLETELSFIVPQSITSEYVKNGGYEVVLLDSSVTTEQRRRLAAGLIGSNASIYYSFPVENGCWWLPLLRCGQDCHGAPAFRRSEFPLELERVLSEPTDA